MLVPPAFPPTASVQNRAAALAELRLLLSRHPGWPQTLQAKLPFGLAALDCHLPNDGLDRGALHEVVPATQAAFPAAFGFVVGVAAHFARTVLTGFGFDPTRAILVETAHRHDSLWALLEALRSGAPQAVIGMIDKLDLKTSQKLHLAATDAGLPLLLLRPSQTLESSAASTRWRTGRGGRGAARLG